MEYVVFYATDPNSAARIPDVYPRHRAYLDEFAARGGLLSIGPFDDPVTNGSMALFASREQAEEFIANDPFVLEGIAIPGGIREWDVLSFR
ncbi:YciI family protein [Rhodococcus tibetensis]|uniref:YciI family protein n=1 Tax=Rhodococcus tibetensis TaxID=2965064 RepID=A0ABT1QGJ1_9NOCA|nr:YciI family protein [Rhodococcus sp. FXJ9.536]MCQ4121322.1 YciI family protein [Rhodococcus sp. FXJ9.536]